MPDATPTSPDQTASSGLSRYHLLLFQIGRRSDVFGDMNRKLFHKIQETLDEKIHEPRNQTEIDVWIESPGGDANVAYKLFLELRHRCCKLRAVVPDYAKSAATLLVLGADEIFMAPAAELGPLDAQIEHPDREGVVISAMDVAEGYDFLAQFAVTLAVTGGAELLNATGLPRSHVLKEFLRFVAMFLRPAVARLDPNLVHKAGNELKVGQNYAEKMLGSRNLSSRDEASSQNPKTLAEHLVRDYPAHDFVICRAEARELGLPIRDTENYDRWPKVKEVYRQLMATGQSIIKVVADPELDQSEPNGEPQNECQGTDTPQSQS